MDIGTILSVANNVTTSLQCYELTQNFLNLGFESELHEFKRTVETLSAVLRDAESKQELTHEIKTKIEQIKTAFYEADDLLDEFVTVARLQRLIDADGTLFEKLRNFFSPSNPICVSYWMSRGIKDIKKKMDAIAYNQQFSLNIDHEPIRKRNRETCSYVNDEFPIIGREKELEHIVDMLLSSNVQQQNISNFFSIVGIGGLGKTALSQLIYNDPRITTAFQLRMWTCIADQDQKQFDVTGVLRKILASATGQNSDQGSTLDWVQFQLREKLAAKKYLLVLDDVWTEDRVQWRELEKYLVTGQEGSWILVTTRSKRTATIVGDGRMHMLQGLSVKNSQKLFRSVAFGSDVSNPPENLVDIGREIVDKCAGVPLAIKMMGSLLYGQDTSKWELVQKLELANIMETEDNVMSILKLSYHHLEYPLQSCFSYCAIFPKDYEILKENLKESLDCTGLYSSIIHRAEH